MKREAVTWEYEEVLKVDVKLDMIFESFYAIYEKERVKRARENTWETKKHIIETKILPVFKERPIAEIEAKDVIAW